MAQVFVRDNMSPTHLWSARLFAEQCSERENALVAAGKLSFDGPHRSLAVATVFSAVAFLEAYVNEVYRDATHVCEGGPGDVRYRLQGLSEENITRLASKWTTDIWPTSGAGESYGLPKKYQSALKCVGQPRFNEETDLLFIDTRSLIQLRNALVHFTPETFEIREPHQLEALLRDRFEPSPIHGDPWYPNKCLGAGLSRWAYKQSIDFVTDWVRRMGLDRDPIAEMEMLPPPAQL